MNQAFSKILQHEKSVSGGVQYEDESRIQINAAAVGTRSYGRGRGANANKVCTHCGKVRHTVDVCYRKHGFPPHFKFRNGSSAHNVFQEENVEMKANEEDTASRGKFLNNQVLV